LLRARGCARSRANALESSRSGHCSAGCRAFLRAMTAVELDFVHPFGAGRRRGIRWKAWRDEARRQGTRVGRHLRRPPEKVESAGYWVRAAFQRRNFAAAIIIPVTTVNVQENSKRSITSPAMIRSPHSGRPLALRA
jgi:transposase InsO family protein